MAAYRPGVLVGNWKEDACLEEVGEQLQPPALGLPFPPRAASSSSAESYHSSPGVDGGSVGEPVKFGQKFALGTTGGFSDPMLYLASDHKSFMRFAKKSYLQQVFLTDELSYLTCWRANFLDPQLRLEYEGFPVPANSIMIITHCYTNRSLAVPRNFWARSYFGREYEVVCHTYLDSHRAEEDKNYWIIATGNPSDEGGTMIHRPEPQPGGIGKNETKNIRVPD
ncbi:UNVERIFIED_CONTAM: hypothetical protein H355_007627 [Colinus virginianus]|nr:hypothetical protein H355_007627 [Colinus virginianus]